MEQLLTVKEAAKLLGLSIKTLYSYTCARKLPFIKIQSSVRFKASDLESWIRKHAVEPIRGGRGE